MERMKNGRRSGIAAVEMALLLPLLLILLFGMIEYGSLFWRSQQVASAARNGARRGVLAGATSTDVTTAVDQVMVASGMGSTNYTVTLTPANPTTLAQGAPFTVEVTVPSVDIQLTGFPVPTPTQVVRSVTMAKEAP